MTRDTSDFSTVLLNATYLAVYVQQTFQDGGKKSLAIIIAHRKVSHIQWLHLSAVLSLEGPASIMEYQLVSIQH